jgi:hypothetical protein
MLFLKHTGRSGAGRMMAIHVSLRAIGAGCSHVFNGCSRLNVLAVGLPLIFNAPT